MMVEDSEAEEWKAKAQRAEEQAAKARDKRTADTWLEIARTYRDLAARRQAWADIWKPRELVRRTDKDDEGKSR